MPVNSAERLNAIIQGARDCGLTIDYLEVLTRNLSSHALRKVIGNASEMPSYMKSSDNPYLWRKTRPPSRETR